MELTLQENYLEPEKLEKKPPRDGAGIGVAQLGEQREDVVVVSSDVAGSARAKFFAEKFPERFVQVGVAEQNAIGVCAGLAYNGLIPYYFAYSVFAVGRSWEPVRTTLAYPKNKVRILASHAGVSTGPDGATHQMTEDIAIMRVLPNFTVISPADFEEAKKAAQAVVDVAGPVYIRLARPALPVFTTEKTPFELGKILELKTGQDVTIIATGPLVYNCLLAAEILVHFGISARVLNCHTIKPLDRATILQAAAKTGRVVTAEDHQAAGGLGGAVAEVLTANQPVPLLRIGIKDRFGESGEPEELYKYFKLDAEGIAGQIREWINKS